MTVALPEPLGWEDLVSVLEGSASTSIPAIALSVLALLAGLLVAVRYDDRHAYTRLFPTWHCSLMGFACPFVMRAKCAEVAKELEALDHLSFEPW